MKIYATQIRRFQGDLELPLTEIDIFTPEEMIELDMEGDDIAKELWYGTSV